MAVFIGIDPGFKGAVFCLQTGKPELAEFFDKATFQVDRGNKKKTELDIAKLANRLAHMTGETTTTVWVEKAQSMPGMGGSGAFAYGQGYGAVLGVLATLKVPYSLVHPTVWKKALQVPKGKDAARARASQLLSFCADVWPLKKHDGRAEAAMIALYGERKAA